MLFGSYEEGLTKQREDMDLWDKFQIQISPKISDFYGSKC